MAVRAYRLGTKKVKTGKTGLPVGVEDHGYKAYWEHNRYGGVPLPGIGIPGSAGWELRFARRTRMTPREYMQTQPFAQKSDVLSLGDTLPRMPKLSGKMATKGIGKLAMRIHPVTAALSLASDAKMLYDWYRS
jgi:hypothetical protein